jgi:hypothetical protein
MMTGSQHLGTRSTTPGSGRSGSGRSGSTKSGSTKSGSTKSGSTRALVGRSAEQLRSGPTPPPRSGLTLLNQARGVLAEASSAPTAADRFRLAHLAALRTSAALFAERARPSAGPRKLLSAWVLVELVAPEFGEWAGYFAAGAATRAAVESGAVSLVSEREADDQLRAAAEFLTLVEQSLGLLATPLAS